MHFTKTNCTALSRFGRKKRKLADHFIRLPLKNWEKPQQQILCRVQWSENKRQKRISPTARFAQGGINRGPPPHSRQCKTSLEIFTQQALPLVTSSCNTTRLTGTAQTTKNTLPEMVTATYKHTQFNETVHIYRFMIVAKHDLFTHLH